MNTTLNIAMIVAFTFLGGWMFVRYFHVRDKLIVQDKTWNFMRISFGMIEVLAVASLLAGGNSILDYIRIAVMVLACTAYMIVRDGLGEEGLVHNGKITPWNQVRAWDKHETPKKIELFFTLESTNPKKPDQYKTIEIDFDPKNKKQVDHFMDINLRRKYTRMKKK